MGNEELGRDVNLAIMGTIKGVWKFVDKEGNKERK